MTLTLVDVAAVAAVIVGPVLIVSLGVAMAWLRADMVKLDERQRNDNAALRADIARLDERQRADTAAINMRLDTLTQTIITSAIARGSQADLPAERPSQPAPSSAASRG